LTLTAAQRGYSPRTRGRARRRTGRRRRCSLFYGLDAVVQRLTGWACSSTGRARPSGPGPPAAPGL